ncbi:hypothetical protein ABIC85_003366 [Oerskovia enterophila]
MPGMTRLTTPAAVCRSRDETRPGRNLGPEFRNLARVPVRRAAGDAAARDEREAISA